MTDDEKMLYAKWISSGKGNPFLEIHFLWEYLHTPNVNETISKEDELGVLKEYLKLEGII